MVHLRRMPGLPAFLLSALLIVLSMPVSLFAETSPPDTGFQSTAPTRADPAYLHGPHSPLAPRPTSAATNLTTLFRPAAASTYTSLAATANVGGSPGSHCRQWRQAARGLTLLKTTTCTARVASKYST